MRTRPFQPHKILIYFWILLVYTHVVPRPSLASQDKQITKVHIRWMIRRDMAEVLDIEGDSFEFPWKEEDFIGCLRQRNCIGMVADHDDKVLGFMVYELHKTRLNILNLAVSKDHRREGIGTQMVEKLVGKLSSQRRTAIMLEVRESNLAAQLFFKANQFRAKTVLRDLYDDTTEDAYSMVNRKYQDVPHNLQLTEEDVKLLDIKIVPIQDFGTPDPRGKNYYHVLGVSPNSSYETITDAYISIMNKEGIRKLDQDKYQLAHEVLSSRGLRQEHDLALDQRGRLPSEKGASFAKLINKERKAALKESKRLEKLQSSGSELSHLGKKSTATLFTKASPDSADLYKRLGVPRNAALDVIVDAYIQAFHELDKNKTNSAGRKTRRLQHIREAFLVLRHPSLRRQYGEVSISEGYRARWEATEALIKSAKRFEITRKEPKRLPEISTIPLSEQRPIGSPAPRGKNPYRILGVAENSSQARIVDAYIDAMLEFRNNRKAAKRIKRAYRMLSNKANRRKHDNSKTGGPWKAPDSRTEWQKSEIGKAEDVEDVEEGGLKTEDWGKLSDEDYEKLFHSKDMITEDDVIRPASDLSGDDGIEPKSEESAKNPEAEIPKHISDEDLAKLFDSPQHTEAELPKNISDEDLAKRFRFPKNIEVVPPINISEEVLAKLFSSPRDSDSEKPLAGESQETKGPTHTKGSKTTPIHTPSAAHALAKDDPEIQKLAKLEEKLDDTYYYSDRVRKRSLLGGTKKLSLTALAVGLAMTTAFVINPALIDRLGPAALAAQEQPTGSISPLKHPTS